MGLGFTAVRDTASFLRWGASAAGNPCAGALDRAYVFGVSQSGRFLRHLLYLGLDEDEAGHFVLDAVIPHVAGARRGEFNLRFGQPSLNAVHAVGSLFPFTDGDQDDPLTGQRGALLHRLASRGQAAPDLHDQHRGRVLARRWLPRAHRRGGHPRRDPAGRRPPRICSRAPSTLRARCPHRPPIPTRAAGACQHVQCGGLLAAPASGAGESRPLGRRGCRTAAERPSRACRRHRGRRGDDARASSRAIPGARFPDRVSCPPRLDFGPEVERGIVAVAAQDRRAIRRRSSRRWTPTATSRAGVRPAELRMPLATFTGWNPRHPEQGAPGDLMSMMGSTLPFARTAAERERTGDPGSRSRSATRVGRTIWRACAVRRRRWWRRESSFPKTWTRWWSGREPSGTSSARAD